MNFSRDDRIQFAQLIGYSVSGFGSLSYASDEVYNAALKAGTDGDPNAVRNAILEEKLSKLREKMKAAVAELYEIHEDDLDYFRGE